MPLRSTTSGSCTLPGGGVLKDEAEAVRWFRLAAEQVHQSVAIPDEGLSDAELENLFAEMERSGSRQSHALAQFNLGVSYAAGRGVLKDEAEAARWYRLAAEQGDAKAQVNLGVIYANGWGVLKDEAEAARWYRLAAEQGDASAQFSLGFMHAAGEGVLKDSVLARHVVQHRWRKRERKRQEVAGQS